jgi:hypothetical protein
MLWWLQLVPVHGFFYPEDGGSMSLTNLTFQIVIFVFITVRTSSLRGREIMIGLNWMLIGLKVFF